jgi:hypothetical protein
MKIRHSIAALFSLCSIVAAGQASADLSADGYPELYGSVLFDEAPAKVIDVAAHPGYGDNYASILLDKATVGTTNVAAQPGYGDNYGSVLLDLTPKNTSYTVVQHRVSNTGSNI